MHKLSLAYAITQAGTLLTLVHSLHPVAGHSMARNAPKRDTPSSTVKGFEARMPAPPTS